MKNICLLFVGLAFSVGSLAAQYKMALFLPDFPPYTQNQHGKPSGLGIDVMLPIFAKLDVDYSIKIASNHGRALNEVRKGASDGFFMASKNAERDFYAIFSEPIMVNRWVWVMQKGSNLNPQSDDFKATGKTAGLLNTNTLKWLTKNGYKVSSKAPDGPALVKFLDAGRADAIFLAEEVFKLSVEDISKYDITVEVEKEFGFYVSREWLTSNPDFMPKLNKEIINYKESL